MIINNLISKDAVTKMCYVTHVHQQNTDYDAIFGFIIMFIWVVGTIMRNVKLKYIIWIVFYIECTKWNWKS